MAPKIRFALMTLLLVSPLARAADADIGELSNPDAKVPGLYWSMGSDYAQLALDDGISKMHFDFFQFAIRRQISDWLAIEGTLGGPLKKERSEDENGQVYSTELSTDIGLYAKGVLPLGRHFGLTGKLGAHYLGYHSEWRDSDRTHSESIFNLAYGPGLQWYVTRHITLEGEWVVFEGTQGDSYAWSAGLRWRFLP